MSPDIIEKLTEFLHRDDITRASSCRSVMVDGEETAVRYWKDSIKGIVQQYLLQCTNGVKRTYVYTHILKNFCMNTMLAGLCNLCDDFGHSNFDAMCTLAQEISNLPGCNIDHAAVRKNLREHQTFLKRKFSKLLQPHSPCLELCMSHALGAQRSSEEHPDTVEEMSLFYSSRESLEEALETSSCGLPMKVKLKEKLNESVNRHLDYTGHLIRTKHQSDYYHYVLKNLKPGECVVIIDYKMKLELGKRTREIQRDWYGKRGISLHGFYVIAQVSEDDRSAEVIDLWSEDTKQDTWFTQSALDIGLNWLENAFPGFQVYLFSGE